MARKKVLEQSKETVDKKTPLKKEYIHAVGRRKAAIARVRLYTGKGNDGKVWVNEKPIEEYFVLTSHKVLYNKPFNVTDTLGKFSATIKVEGGGKSGQLEAIIHGLARAIEKYDSKAYRPLLKKHGLLTRDARSRQRRMVGTGGKARRKKQSPKR